jgi:hypothetical protein
VALLRDDGRQTQIVTNRTDLAAVEIADRMFARWRQENFFKYAKEEFALDALDTYEAEPEDLERSVPNPVRTRLEKEMRKLRAEEERLAAEVGRAAEGNAEGRIPTVRGFKIAHAPLRAQLREVRRRLEKLAERRRGAPERVALGEAVSGGERAEKLEVERKHFMNLVKMAVYRAETALLALLCPHYARGEDEGRALLREAFRSSGELPVVDGHLRENLDPLSAPRRSQAIDAVCTQLNEQGVRIPGTTLILNMAVRAGGCLK